METHQIIGLVIVALLILLFIYVSTGGWHWVTAEFLITEAEIKSKAEERRPITTQEKEEKVEEPKEETYTVVIPKAKYLMISEEEEVRVKLLRKSNMLNVNQDY